MSRVLSRNENSRIPFREGASMLVPYYAFDLSSAENKTLVLDHVYLGPTSNIELSMTSLELFLAQRNVTPSLGISYCDIPYRQR